MDFLKQEDACNPNPLPGFQLCRQLCVLIGLESRLFWTALFRCPLWTRKWDAIGVLLDARQLSLECHGANSTKYWWRKVPENLSEMFTQAALLSLHPAAQVSCFGSHYVVFSTCGIHVEGGPLRILEHNMRLSPASCALLLYPVAQEVLFYSINLFKWKHVSIQSPQDFKILRFDRFTQIQVFPIISIFSYIP